MFKLLQVSLKSVSNSRTTWQTLRRFPAIKKRLLDSLARSLSSRCYLIVSLTWCSPSNLYSSPLYSTPCRCYSMFEPIVRRLWVAASHSSDPSLPSRNLGKKNEKLCPYTRPSVGCLNITGILCTKFYAQRRAAVFKIVFCKLLHPDARSRRSVCRSETRNHSAFVGTLN